MSWRRAKEDYNIDSVSKIIPARIRSNAIYFPSVAATSKAMPPKIMIIGDISRKFLIDINIVRKGNIKKKKLLRR